jgi:uncharacterized protein YjbI with pentapeptide repeats
MKKINETELKAILQAHALWLSGTGGARMMLVDANLEGANLEGANLKGAYLECANLKGAYLECANLEGANLIGANLYLANLRCANLKGAHLEGANLEGAYLKGAHLEGANLEGANLEDTCLEGMGEPTKLQQEQVVGEAQTLRAKFDEFAKSLGLEIVTLSVKRTVVETINL